MISKEEYLLLRALKECKCGLAISEIKEIGLDRKNSINTLLIRSLICRLNSEDLGPFTSNTVMSVTSLASLAMAKYEGRKSYRLGRFWQKLKMLFT